MAWELQRHMHEYVPPTVAKAYRKHGRKWLNQRFADQRWKESEGTKAYDDLEAHAASLPVDVVIQEVADGAIEIGLTDNGGHEIYLAPGGYNSERWATEEEMQRWWAGTPDETDLALRAAVERVFQKNLLESAARAFWVDAYASFQEAKARVGRRAVMAGRGEDWMDVAPKTPKKALVLAANFLAEVERLNKKPLMTLWLIEAEKNGIEPDNQKLQRVFGHYLAMQGMGHGVSWEDDHEKLGFKLPRVEGLVL